MSYYVIVLMNKYISVAGKILTNKALYPNGLELGHNMYVCYLGYLLHKRECFSADV